MQLVPVERSPPGFTQGDVRREFYSADPELDNPLAPDMSPAHVGPFKFTQGDVRREFDWGDPELDTLIDADLMEQAREDVELLQVGLRVVGGLTLWPHSSRSLHAPGLTPALRPNSFCPSPLWGVRRRSRP